MEIRDRRGGFLWINNEVIDCYASRIGPSALLVYVLLCRYAHNVTAESRPAQETMAEALQLDVRTIRRCIRILERENLIETSRTHVAGKWDQNTYTLLSVLPDTSDRSTGHSTGHLTPVSTGHSTGHQTPMNKTEQDYKENKTEQDLPNWLPVDSWQGFVQMRKQMAKIPFTDRAQKLAIAELEKLRSQGHDPGAVLDQSTLKGWRGLFPISNGGNGDGHKTSAELRSERFDQMAERALRKIDAAKNQSSSLFEDID